MKIPVIILLAILWTLRAVEIHVAQKNKKPGRISRESKLTFIFLAAAALTMNLVIVLELLLADRELILIMTVCGLAVLLVRTALKYWCVGALGKFWSANIEIREEHQLIESGPYKFMRHPAYVANLMEALAYSLIANSYGGMLIVSFVLVPAVLVRIYFEEKELVHIFGSKYLEYRTKTWALIPFRSFLVDFISSRV